MHVAPNKITFAQWAKIWLSLKIRSVAGQTLDRYEDLLNIHITPKLGPVRLQKITATDIDRLYEDTTLAAATLALVHFVVKSCLKSAVKKKLIPSNPAEDAEKPSGAEDEAGLVLDEEQLARLVAGFKDHNLYPIVAVAAYTGMRKGEVLALRWCDIDLARGGSPSAAASSRRRFAVVTKGGLRCSAASKGQNPNVASVRSR